MNIYVVKSKLNLTIYSLVLRCINMLLLLLDVMIFLFVRIDSIVVCAHGVDLPSKWGDVVLLFIWDQWAVDDAVLDWDVCVVDVELGGVFVSHDGRYVGLILLVAENIFMGVCVRVECVSLFFAWGVGRDVGVERHSAVLVWLCLVHFWVLLY